MASSRSLRACKQLLQSSSSSYPKCLLKALYAVSRSANETPNPCFAKNMVSTIIPLMSRSSATTVPNSLGNVQEAHISGPCAMRTKGAENCVPSTTNTLSYKASWVNANPIALPSTNAKIGLSERIMLEQSQLRSCVEASTSYSRAPRASTYGSEKLVRSLPEEKLPPAPVITMNRTLSSRLADRICSLNCRYIRRVNALRRAGRLRVSVQTHPD